MSDEDLVQRLRATTQELGTSTSVTMMMWQNHSSACFEAADTIEKKDAALRQALIVLGDMVSMMDEGDEHGAASSWHTDAKDAIAQIKRVLGIAQEDSHE